VLGAACFMDIHQERSVPQRTECSAGRMQGEANKGRKQRTFLGVTPKVYRSGGESAQGSIPSLATYLLSESFLVCESSSSHKTSS